MGHKVARQTCAKVGLGLVEKLFVKHVGVGHEVVCQTCRGGT